MYCGKLIYRTNNLNLYHRESSDEDIDEKSELVSLREECQSLRLENEHLKKVDLENKTLKTKNLKLKLMNEKLKRRNDDFLGQVAALQVEVEKVTCVLAQKKSNRKK